MRRKCKIIAACLVLAVLSVFTVGAQESAISKATFGQIDADADNYLDVSRYSDVQFDKWFGYGTYLDSKLQLGYATKIGGIYIGTYYNGFLFQQSNQTAETRIDTRHNITTGLLIDTTTSKFWDSGDDLSTNNTVGVLVGVAGMGFKLGFTENLKNSARPFGSATLAGVFTAAPYGNPFSAAGNAFYYNVENVNGSTLNGEITDYAASTGIAPATEGYLTPSLDWGGLQIGLGGMTLKPYAGFDFRIGLNDERFKASYDDTVVSGASSNGSVESVNANNYLRPSIWVGADLEFAKKGNASNGVGLRYAINFDIYGNAYGDEYANGTVNWRKSSFATINPAGITTQERDINNVTINEKTAVRHTITPSYSYFVDATSRISVGFTASAVINVRSETAKDAVTNVTTITDYNPTTGVVDGHTTTTTTSNTVNQEESTFSIAPTLALGAQFHIIPNRLLLNAGVKVDAFNYTVTTTTNKPLDLQKEVEDSYNQNGVLTGSTVSTSFDGTITDRQTVADSWGNVVTNVGLGLTFQVNEHFSVDGLASVGISPLQINVWNTLVMGTYSLYLTLNF
ncbi:hypothetical protein FACS189483_01050 [Spirochaetia bacterium]|nr:hypothetical protein FACS189483_01050 [Spirochaetia bacterium]